MAGNRVYPDLDKQIFAYLEGELSEEEKTAFESSLKESADLSERLDEVRGHWVATRQPGRADEITEAGWGRYHGFIESDRMKTRSRRLRRVWSVAASVLLVMGSLLFWWNSDSFQRNSQTGALAGFENDEEQAPEEVTLALSDGSLLPLAGQSGTIALNDSLGTALKRGNTLIYKKGDQRRKLKSVPKINTLSIPRGKRFSVALSDGTKVWLNSDSKLRYPTEFSGDVREVFLTGEAYFEVTKDSKRPFVVKVEDLDIRVFGTAFNVTNYPETSGVRTVLVEGSVGIAKRSQGEFNRKGAVMLKPSQSALYDIQENKMRKETLGNLRFVTAWKDNTLAFYNEPFSSLKTRLERWYDIRIDNQSEALVEERFSGVFRNKSLEKVLELFATTFPVEIIRKGDKVLIKEKSV
ncbi:anti-sigma factor [Fulvitalea axinellae]|uniref:Anti-sigma factor n=1 Tax=Fulvitalea axinellae TaxID=1182444 RepID=A0AAU9D622_9BACT|nr:anti-sigma factor [Fulvitalea axinellae]